MKATVRLFGREFLTFAVDLDDDEKPAPVDTPTLADTALGGQRDPDTRAFGFHTPERPEARA
jgi:hypothetical protein